MSKHHQYNLVPIELLKPGDIVFLHTHSLLAKLIQMVCNSYWDNAILITRVFLDDNVGIVENGKFGILPNLLKYYNDADKIILRPKKYTNYDGVKVFQQAYRLNIKHNNWYQIIQFLITYKINKPKAKMPCAEMIIKAWENAGISLLEKNDATTLKNIMLQRENKLDIIWGINKN